MDGEPAAQPDADPAVAVAQQALTPPPTPDPKPEVDPAQEVAEQYAGLQKNLLASSMAKAVESSAVKRSKTLAIADKLNLPEDYVTKNYETLSQQVPLRNVDYNRLLTHHPELASWLADPKNSSIAHDQIPQLQTMDAVARQLGGDDVTGFLPPGYMFKKDGTIRGPVNADGTPPMIYANIDALHAKFGREVAQAEADTVSRDAMSEGAVGSATAGLEAAVGTTAAAVVGAFSHVPGYGNAGATAARLREASAMRLQASETANPGLASSGARLVGQLIGDAPLYLLGGEVAAWSDAVQSFKAIQLLTKPLAAVPRSEYLADVWRTAVAYSPVAARSGINEGQEHGAAYGTTDFLINALGPAGFGSRFGLAHAIVPGAEVSSPGSWAGVAGRLALHSGSQGGIMAATEWANALHEVATGVNPDALKAENLIPRLGQAGLLGAAMSGAFHLPTAIREQTLRQHVASVQALDSADKLSYLVEAVQAIPIPERSPGRFDELFTRILQPGQRTTYFQPEEIEGIAKIAGMTPHDFAAAMQQEGEFERARAMGTSMAVPTKDVVLALSKLEPAGVRAGALAARMTPTAMNGHEAVAFRKEAPGEIDGKLTKLQEDAKAAAAAVQPEDPIYKDVYQKAIAANEQPDAADSAARLVAAQFNTAAEHWNAEPNAEHMDPHAEYQKYNLRIANETPKALRGEGIESTETVLNRLRAGDLKEPSAKNKKAVAIHEQAMEALHHLAQRGIDIAKPNIEILRELDYPGSRMEQPGEPSEGYRGSMSWGSQRQFTAILTKYANLTTLGHEVVGHFGLEVMGDFAERAGAPERFKTDYATILKHLGVTKRSEIGEKQHELFARSIEQYLWEGKAPSEALKPVFHRFLLWMGHIYQKFKALVHLTPEVRGAFDRLYASDEAIRRAKEDLGTSELFPDQASSGMNDRQWARYLTAIRDSRDRAHAKVFNSAMATLRRENTKTYKVEHQRALVKAEKVVDQMPVFVAHTALTRGMGPKGPLQDEEGRFATPKLDRSDVEVYLGKGNATKLLHGLTADDGFVLSLNEAAELFHFPNGEALVTALRNLPDRKAAIQAEAAARMKEDHPDLTPEGMAEKAMEAVHNSSGADVLSYESAALAIKAQTAAVPQERIIRVAEGEIAKTGVKDIRADRYLLAQRRAAREVREALLKKEPDYRAALEANQRAELAYHCYRAAERAEGIIEKAHALMKDIAKKDTRMMLGKAGSRPWVVVDSDGMSVPFAEHDSAVRYAEKFGGTVDGGTAYLEQMDDIRAAWEDYDTQNKLTFGQLETTYNAVRMLLTEARNAHRIGRDEKAEQLATVVVAGVATEAANSKGAIKVPHVRTKGVRVREYLSKFDHFLTTVAALCKQMDGGHTGGWHWEHIQRPLNQMADHEVTLKVANAEAMQALHKEYGKRGLMKTEFIPAINEHLSLENRIMVFLNAGSSRNLERLINPDGYHKWTREGIDAIISTLDEKDIAFAVGVRKHIESYYDQIAAVHKRMHGIEPVKRDAIPIRTRFGMVDGGYFPIVYDPRTSVRTMELSAEAKRGPVLRGEPNAGFTKATVETTGRGLLLNSTAYTNHLDKVMHYISHAEGVADLNKLLSNPTLSEHMASHFGMDAYQTIVDRVKTVAEGGNGPRNAAETALRFMRQRTGLATMTGNVMSAVSNYFGLPQSMRRVGYGAYTSAVLKMTQSAEGYSTWNDFIQSKSAFMRNYQHTVVQETLESLDRGVGGKSMSLLHKHGYWLMHKSNQTINNPTWLAEYETQLKANPEDEAKAIALADQAVIDTQGSGLTKDMTKAQDANEMARALMQYGSFFTRTYNELRPAVKAALAGDPNSIQHLAGAFISLVAFPAITMSIFKQAVRPSKDNDGSAAYWASHLAKDQIGYLMSTVILGRDVAGGLSGYDYSGPAGFRGISLLSSLAKHLSTDFTDKADGTPHSKSGLARAAFMAGAGFFGLPATQVDHIIQGMLWDRENDSRNPLPLIFGPPTSK